MIELYAIFAALCVCKGLSSYVRFLCLVAYYLQSIVLSTTHLLKTLAFCHFDFSLLSTPFITAFEIFKVSILIWKKKASVLQKTCSNVPLVVLVKATRNRHCKRAPFARSQPAAVSPYMSAQEVI